MLESNVMTNAQNGVNGGRRASWGALVQGQPVWLRMDSFAVYQAVLAENPGKPIYLIGESGGAYLCITTAMKCRDNGVKLPTAIVPYSPPIEFMGVLDRHFEGNEDFTVTPEGLGALGDSMLPNSTGETSMQSLTTTTFPACARYSWLGTKTNLWPWTRTSLWTG